MGDVFADPDRADHVALVVAERREREQDVADLPVLGEKTRFVVLDVSRLFKLRDRDVPLPRVNVEAFDMLADQFPPPVSERLFPAPVEGFDQPVGIAGDDDVGRILHDPFQILLGVAQLVSKLRLVGGVFADADGADYVALAVAQARKREQDIADLSVLGQ